MNYDELDAAICDHIERQSGHATTSALLERIAQRFTGGVAWRLIDRRMQEMRKAGRIRYLREIGLKPRWVVCEPPNV